MVVALDSNSSFTKCVSLNSSIACSFSLLSSVVCSISYACLSIVSSAERQTWYCPGKYSVAYYLMDSLAWFLKYCMSELMVASYTCSSRAISTWLKPLDRISTTFNLLHFTCSALGSDFVLKVQKFPS